MEEEKNQFNDAGWPVGYWERIVVGLLIKCFYKNGVLHGLYETFYSKNKKLISSGNMDNGKGIGRWKFYNKRGKLEKEIIYI